MPSKRDDLYAAKSATKPVGYEGSVSDRLYLDLMATNATGDPTPTLNDLIVAAGQNKNQIQ